MKITRVEYQNLKGRSEAVDLSAATLIVGRNFRGKTTIVDAIKLAMLGYHPNHAKTGQAIFRLASGNPLTTTVTLEDYLPAYTNRGAQSHVHRSLIVGNEWRADARGAVSKRTFGPPPGTIPETPIVSLDPLAYFAATPRQRVDLIFAAAIVERGSDRLREVAEKLDQLGVVCAQITDDVSGWLATMLDRVERARSDAAANEKRYKASVQTAPQAAESFPENLSETLATKRTSLEEHLAKLATLQPSLAAVEKIEAEIEECKTKRASLRRQVEEKAEEIRLAAIEKSAMLNYDKCPTCGTLGRAWHSTYGAAMDAKIVQLGDDRGNLVRELNSVEDAIGLREKDADKARKRSEKKNEKQRAKLNEDVAELREEIATLEAQEKRRTAYESAEKLRDATRRRWEDAKRDTERFGKAKEHLISAKYRFANSVFESVLEVARKFTVGIIEGRLEITDDELGIFRDRQWIPSETFSGTEQAIVFAAFQAALGAKAPVKLAILDELGRIDAANKERLLENVFGALRDGTIDQFIGVDTELPAVLRGEFGRRWRPEDWRIVER